MKIIIIKHPFNSPTFATDYKVKVNESSKYVRVCRNNYHPLQNQCREEGPNITDLGDTLKILMYLYIPLKSRYN